ncbi:MAG TPA: class III signal peptide-containing protein [Methanobacterium sp.]|nr:class III signal peptide-containing protein [Methanobacterium sp.]
MDARGQISAEYLLLIVVILTIMTYITIPFMGQSIDASNDVSWTSDAKNAVSSIATAVNLVYANGPQSKRSLTVHIPKNGMQLTYNNSYLFLNTVLNNGTSKPVNSSVNYPVTVNAPTLTSDWYNANITWTPGSTSINVNLTKA